MPRTSYWFWVAPFKLAEGSTEEVGDWSDIKVISTYDNQDISQDSLGHHASVVTKKQEKWVNFEKQGLVYG